MKALTLVLCILALLGSAASGYFWFEVGNKRAVAEAKAASETARANAAEAERDQKNAALEQTNAKLAETDAALGDTKRSLTAAEARNVQTARELDAAKRTISAKEDAEKKLNADLDQLRRELVQTRLAAQVGSPEELEKAKQTIASLEAKIAELQGKTGSVATVSADGTVVPAKPALSERTAAAKVAQVGSKNAFVVLDLGVADGIAVGNKFDIKRGDDVIAESVISEVKDTFAIAQVTPSSIKTSLKAGDVAAYRN